MPCCKRAGKRLVLYSGNHGVVNALDTVLEAARLLGDRLPIHWLLVETLLEIGALSPGQLREIGARGRQHIEHTHSYVELARRYAELF